MALDHWPPVGRSLRSAMCWRHWAWVFLRQSDGSPFSRNDCNWLLDWQVGKMKKALGKSNIVIYDSLYAT